LGRQGGVWAAFLAMCFLVLGLVGGFALYAGPVPLQRALARGEVLDEALVAARGADSSAALERLRPALGSSAKAVLDGAGPVEARIAAERTSFRAQMEREAAAVTARIRLMLIMVTLMCALFGVGILGMSRRS